jgi:hypothetical protein
MECRRGGNNERYDQVRQSGQTVGGKFTREFLYLRIPTGWSDTGRAFSAENAQSGHYGTKQNCSFVAT